MHTSSPAKGLLLAGTHHSWQMLSCHSYRTGMPNTVTSGAHSASQQLFGLPCTHQVLHKDPSGNAHSTSSKCFPVLHTALERLTPLPVGHTAFYKNVGRSCIHQVLLWDSILSCTQHFQQTVSCQSITALYAYHCYQCCTQYFPTNDGHAHIKSCKRTPMVMYTAFLAKCSSVILHHWCAHCHQWCTQHFPSSLWPAMDTSSPAKESYGHVHNISGKCFPVMHTALGCLTLPPVGHTAFPFTGLPVMHTFSPA